MEDIGLHIDAHGEGVDVWYDRPARLEEIAYTLEFSSDAITWIEILGPTISSEYYGREHVRYADIQRLDEVSRERGFVRLRIKHHEWNHETTTPICGWYETPLRAGYQTHGLSLNREPVFGSTVSQVEDETLIASSAGLLDVISPNRAYYMEFTSGAKEGHRVDVDEDAVEDQRIAIDWSVNHNTLDTLSDEDLRGSSFVIREHWTMADAYRKELFHPSTDPVDADQIQFFNGQEYNAYFLLGDDDESYWVSAEDDELTSKDGLVIPPGVGSFIKRPEGQENTSLLVVGHFRSGAFVQPLAEGYNLVSLSRPMDANARDRALTFENGFLGSRDLESADQIQVWLGDRSAGKQGYGSYFLFDGGQPDRRFWTSASSADLQDHGWDKIFAHDRAFFIRLSSEAHPNYRVPAFTAPRTER